MLKDMHAVYLHREDGSIQSEPIALFEFADQITSWLEKTYNRNQCEIIKVKVEIKFICSTCKGAGVI